MKDKLWFTRIAFFFLLISALLLGSTFQAAARPQGLVIVPGGTITTDTTWTTTNSPYLITGGVVVNPGVTLTIEPGVVVKFNGSTSLVILGTLDVNGMDGSPVIFTEYRDDTAGGDTNGDGSATSPAPGGWNGMYVTDNANASFDYAEIRYGGAVFFNGDRTDAHYGNLRKDGAGTLTLNHVLVTKSNACGVRFDGTTGTHTITDSTFSFNGGSGACLNDAVNTITFSGSTFSQNSPWSISTTTKSSGFAIPPDNLLDKPIFVNTGGMAVDNTWSRQVYVTYGFSVNAGVTLHIPAGAVLKFMNVSSLVVNGTLDVNGMDGSPVIFTEYRDDTAGGDSNGDGSASSPAPGAWAGMYVTDNANASFDYTEIRYGGAVFFDGNRDDAHYGNLRKDGAGTLTLDHTLVTKSNACGLRLDNTTGTVTITNSTFSFNGNHGACLNNAANTASFSGSTFSQNNPWSIYTTINSSGFAIPPGNLLDKPIFVNGGGMAVDNTWSRQVYVTYGFSVNAGVTLHIPAGAVLKFMNVSSLVVYGTLDVNGMDGSPVIFTESRDDTAGGDTNGDGSATSPAPGGWNGMYVTDNANASFDYAEIRYGGAVFFDGDRTDAHYGNLRKDGAGTLTLNHVLVTKSNACGVRFDGTTGTHTITDSTFSFNGGSGACLNDAVNTITFSGSTFSQNSPWSISTTTKSSGFAIPPDNLLDKPIFVNTGGMAVDNTWSQQVYVTYGFSVNAGVTLHIPAGAVLKFMNMSGITVLGTLDVNGTEALPAIITEFRDDTAGGDSNGDAGATSPAPGAWTGLFVVGGGNASFDYAEIRYGGGYFFNGERDACHYGNLRKDGGGWLTTNHLTSTHSGCAGLWLTGAVTQAEILDSHFLANNGWGLLFQSSSSDLLAQRNLIEANLSGGLHINNPGGVNEIVQNTIVANTGAGIQVTNDSTALIGGADPNGNNLYGNTALQLQNLNGSVSVNATHNWWGLNPPKPEWVSGLVDITSPLGSPAAYAPPYLADIVLTAVSLPDKALTGEVVEYEFQVRNDGPREAYHLWITATIPDPAVLLSVSAPDWTCDGGGSTFGCYLPYLAVDDSAALSFTLSSEHAFPLRFNVAVAQANNDPDSLSNLVSVDTGIFMQIMLPLVIR